MVFQNCLIDFYFNPFSAFCKQFFNFFANLIKNTILIKIELFPKHHDDHQQDRNNHHQIHKKSSHSRMMVPLFICLRPFFLNLFKPLVGMLFNHIVQSIVIAMMIDSVRCHPKTLPNHLLNKVYDNLAILSQVNRTQQQVANRLFSNVIDHLFKTIICLTMINRHRIAL